MMFLIPLMFLIFFFMPEQAFAWGPGVHLAAGSYILANPGIIAPSIATCLLNHPGEFLYGCLSADIFIGKGVKFNPKHSHNWSNGFKLLQSSKTPELKSYAYGYLTHLAADVVAHNYFIPNQLGISPVRGNFGHVYYEIQADMKLNWSGRPVLKYFHSSCSTADISLLSVLDQKRFPFMLKKQMFRSGLLIADKKFWHNIFNSADQILPFENGWAFTGKMFDLTKRVVVDFLQDPKNSTALSFDPIGSRNLGRVRLFRPKRRHRALETRPIFPTDRRLEELPAPCNAEAFDTENLMPVFC